MARESCPIQKRHRQLKRLDNLQPASPDTTMWLTGMSSQIASPRLRLSRLLWAAGVLAIVTATLTPMGSGEPRLDTLCLVCGERGLANIIGNVLLFAPLGAALALGRIPPVRIVLAAVLLSAGIEAMQHLVPGRNPNPADTLFNALGAAAGAWLVRSSRHWLFARGPLRSGLGTVALVVVLAIFAGSAALASSSFPNTVYFGQWPPDHARVPAHPGHVLEARVGPLPIPSTRLEDGGRVRALLAAGEPIEIHAVVGPAVPETWPIFRIADARERSIVVAVARQGDDILVRFRTRATAVRLHPPGLRIQGAFAHAPADEPIWIRIWHGERGPCVEVAGSTACSQGATVGRGWALIHDITPLRSPWRQLLDMAWLAGLLLPVGYWLRPPRQVAAAAAAVAAALLLIPAVSTLLPTPPLEFTAAFLGLFAGSSLSGPRCHGHAN
jgi:VanZ family protein